MARVDDNGSIVERSVLSGFGAGVGFSIAAELPLDLSFSFSTLKAPGSGSSVRVTNSAPTPVQADFFEGLCVILSADLVFGFVDKSSSFALSLPIFALAMPLPLALMSTKAIGLIEGLGFASTVAGALSGMQAFRVSTTAPIFGPPPETQVYQNATNNLMFTR